MADLQELFEKSQANLNDSKMEFTSGETANFKKAFDDPEFRKMFTEYMDEMQDPNNKKETEDYIKQLEVEQKVPQGKELVRPIASFVAKTYKVVDGVKGDKVFINIVSSQSILVPSKTTTTEGETWSLPYSLGPPHMEKDKNESNVACFDCCFHPDAIAQMEQKKQFRNSLVLTAIEGIEEAYKRQKQETKICREYHVLKGIAYKQGLIPAMLVDTATKNKEWNTTSKGQVKAGKKGDNNDVKNGIKAAHSSKGPTVLSESNEDLSPPAKVIMKTKEIPNGIDKPVVPPTESTKSKTKTSVTTAQHTISTDKTVTSTPFSTPTIAPASTRAPVPTPAIKKGFLNNAKSTVYPESVTAKIKKSSVLSPPIILPSKYPSASDDVKNDSSGNLSHARTNSTVSTHGGSLVQELTESELKELKKTGTVSKPKNSAPIPPDSSSGPGSIGLTVRSSTSSNSIENNNNANDKSNDASIGEKGIIKEDNRAVDTNNVVGVRSENKLIPPIAQVSHDSAPPSASLSTSSSSPSSSTSNPTNQPKYTLVERGIVSMGDFDSLKAKVASNRPSELVCKISVPLVTKASMMVLDVAERQLQFSYLDMYVLSVPLPYPIFDKKGVAKYDKVAKTLTVTMPVQPPTQPKIEENPLFSETQDAKTEPFETENETESNGTKKEKESTGNRSTSAIALGQKVKKDNSRWIGDENDKSSVSEASRRCSEELKKEIQCGVEQSQKTIASSAKSTTAPTPTPLHTISQSSPPSPPPSSSTSSFLPCATFDGRKEGFLFRRGDLGQGYYLDKETPPLPLPPTIPADAVTVKDMHTPTPTTQAAISPSLLTTGKENDEKKGNEDNCGTREMREISAIDARTPGRPPKPCTFEYRQTPQAVAVLIQVPDILLDSASVSFGDSSADLSFMALGSDSRIGSTVHINPTVSMSPAVAKITSANTAFNSSQSIRQEESNISMNSLNPEQISKSDSYRFRLKSVKKLKKSMCTYDIASKNMVIVLTKDEEGYWSDTEESPIVSMMNCTSGEGVNIDKDEKRCTPEPNLIALSNTDKINISDIPATKCSNEVETQKKSSTTDDKIEKQLLEELNKMKFSSQPNFDLD